MRRSDGALLASILGLSLPFAGPAHADEPADPAIGSGLPTPVSIETSIEGRQAARDSVAPPRARTGREDLVRPWLYLADPSGPSAGHALASMAVGIASLDRGAAFPLAADVARAGAVMSAGGEVTIAGPLGLAAEGSLAGTGASAPVSVGAMGGFVLRLPANSPVDVAATVGWLRELGGDHGPWARVAVAGDIGRLRVGASALGEKLLSPSRDAVDVLVTTGATVALVGGFRLGAEYVGQDLEDAWEREEADGGIRHLAGPTAALELADRRIHLAAGPAFGLSAASPRIVGRLAATLAF